MYMFMFMRFIFENCIQNKWYLILYNLINLRFRKWYMKSKHDMLVLLKHLMKKDKT